MDLFIRNISQLVTVASHGRAAKIGREMRELGIISNAGVVCRGGKIVWVGPMSDVPTDIGEEIPSIDGTDKVALPGFVDSHTHAMFADGRELEFAMRAEGMSYQEIAKQGGGILKSVRQVRASSKRELKRLTARHLVGMLRLGTTTVEIKSGYGLSNDSEMMMLEGIREVADEELMSVVGTFLGAHAIPPEYAGREDAYVDLIISTMLPYIARRGLAEFCDVFCEPGYFTLEQTEKILGAARDSGLKRKVHADELQSSGGAEMAARMGATSADHLEHVSSAGIDALAASGTVGCVLPGVSMFLGHGYAPARRLIDAGAVVAIASDFNPGSCMSYSMPLMMTLACTQMRMTPEEALCASTLHGAAALGRSHEIGSIEVGKNADILLASVPDFRYLAYHVGVNHISTIIKNGTILEL